MAHFRSVCESADCPVILYDVPGRTGLHVELETYRRLSELKHVEAVKDATGDLAAVPQKRQETGLAWYSGDDGLYLPFLALGAVGIISVMAHVASGPMQDLAARFDTGDLTGAQRLAATLAPLVQTLNGDGQQAVMAKAALKVAGSLDETTMRLPNLGPGKEQLSKAKAGMKAAGLI